jgi:hypothetical protein
MNEEAEIIERMVFSRELLTCAQFLYTVPYSTLLQGTPHE